MAYLNTTVKFVGSIPMHSKATSWCYETFGEYGEKWRGGYTAKRDYLFHFVEEADALLFRLRWS